MVSALSAAFCAAVALFAAAVAFCPAVVALADEAAALAFVVAVDAEPDADVAEEAAAVAFVVAVDALPDADVSLFFALVAAVVASVTFELITPSRISNCVSTLVIRVSTSSGAGVQSVALLPNSSLTLSR